MSTVLYYSKFCQNCQKLLTNISKSDVKNDIHFICIDKRVKDQNNQVFVVLENGQKVILPPTVTKVPALLLLNKNHHVLFGNEITDYLRPDVRTNTKQTVNMSKEPMAFSLGGSMCGVSSDAYSYLDQSPEDLNSQGQGGLRQMHNYVTHDSRDNIETPPDTWQPDKVGGDITMEKIMEQRQQEIPQQKRPDI